MAYPKIPSGEIETGFFRANQIQAFLTAKWERELDYRLCKSLWSHQQPDCGSISVRVPRRQRTVVSGLWQ